MRNDPGSEGVDGKAGRGVLCAAELGDLEDGLGQGRKLDVSHTVASIMLGWLLLDEMPPPLVLVGGTINLAGVFLVNTRGEIQCGSRS